MGFLLTLDTQRLYWIIYMSATTTTFVFFSRHFVFFFGSDSSSLLYFQMYPEGPLRNSPNLPYPASYEEVHFYLLFTYIHLFPRFENFGRIMAVRLTLPAFGPPCLLPKVEIQTQISSFRDAEVWSMALLKIVSETTSYQWQLDSQLLF